MSKARRAVSSLGSVKAFVSGRACSDAMFHVINRAFDQPSKPEEPAAMPLAGGIMQHGYQCGLIWGAALGAGAQAYRLHGPGPQAEAVAIVAAERLVRAFRELYDTIDCVDISGIDKSSTSWDMVVRFLIKGGTIGCLRMTGRFGPVAFRQVESALSEPPIEAPAAPVSCAAELARKMGLSDRHAAMAAGLAGGLGLSGGGCGALGAAVWILGMKSLEDGAKLDFKTPAATAAIERFLKCSDYELECAEIVGRKFESVEDHAAYVRDGGCSKILEALAAT